MSGAKRSLSGWIFPKYAVNVVVDLIDMMMDRFLSYDTRKLVLFQIIFVTLDEMLVHRRRGLVFKIIIDLRKENRLIQRNTIPLANATTIGGSSQITNRSKMQLLSTNLHPAAI